MPDVAECVGRVRGEGGTARPDREEEGEDGGPEQAEREGGLRGCGCEAGRKVVYGLVCSYKQS